jgi:hypothetical protein
MVPSETCANCTEPSGITFIGGIICIFVLPETKGIPLEEIARIFGETDDVMVYSEDLHWDRNTHKLVVEEHVDHGASLTHMPTKGKKSGEETTAVEKVGQRV